MNLRRLTWPGRGAAPVAVKGRGRTRTVFFALAILFVLSATLLSPVWQGELQAGSPPSRFIPVVTWNYQNPFPSSQDAILAKYSMSDVGAAAYIDSSGQKTWNVVHSLNPTHQIYSYEGPMEAMQGEDDAALYPPVYLNSIVRWDNARGHSMGNLNQNNPDLFLLDSRGRRIQHTVFKWCLLDVGNPKLWQYWEEAATTDKINQAWKADGLYIDGPGTQIPSGLSTPPAKYTTDAAWASGAVNFVLGLTSALHAKGQKAWFNLGPTYTSVGSAAWITLDSSPNYPDVMMDEGAFVTCWTLAFAGFRDEASIVYSLTTMQSVKNSRAALNAAVNGLPGGAGLDNYGNPVTYWDAFYFGLSCFLLGKNTVANNSYFSWQDNNTAVQWFSEFDINLGAATGPYQMSPYGTSHIYWREYQKGYVYVNLSNTDVTGIVLADVCKKVTHNNVINPFANSPTITTLNLPAHRAAILVRSSVTSWQ